VKRGRDIGSLVVALVLAFVAVPGMLGPVLAATPATAATAATPATPATAATAVTPATAGSSDPTSLDLSATYDVRASLTWASGRIVVSSDMHVVNTSGGPIKHLELNALPASIGHLHLGTVRVDGLIVGAHVHGQTIIVPLGPSLAPSHAVDVSVRYHATFSPNTYDYFFLFSRANGILSAYRWIPWISRDVPVPSGRWHGDPFVTPSSPSVRVTLDSDVPLRFATSGKEVAHTGNSHTFVAHDVRDFNFTAARGYHRLVGLSIDGQTTIQIMTRSLDPHVILNWARKSIAAYEAKLGPYPWPTLTYGEGSGGVGMESPGLIWLPYHWSASELPYLVGHETAHEWFYAAVGNDQITDSFADEAMAEFMDRWLLNDFRGSNCPKARLDLSIYQYSASCYFEQLYVQGANFVNQLRRDMGNTAFWEALHAYWNTEEFKISSNKILLDTLRSYAPDGAHLDKRLHARFPSLY